MVCQGLLELEDLLMKVDVLARENLLNSLLEHNRMMSLKNSIAAEGMLEVEKREKVALEISYQVEQLMKKIGELMN
jgi:pyrroline-5-carboxylate reductase